MASPRKYLSTSVAVALSVCFVVSPRAETSQGADARARATLDRAIDAMGGRARLETIRTWLVEGEGRENLTAEAQGASPEEPTWREHEERLAVDLETLSVAWQRRTPRNDMSLRHRRFIYEADASGFVDFVSGAGGKRPSTNPEAQRRGFARRVPHALLLELTTRADLRFEAERLVDASAQDVVTAVLPEGVVLTVSFDREPPALSRVSFRRHLPTRGDVNVVYEWHGWRADDAYGLVPTGHRVLVDETVYQELDYTRYGASPREVAAMMEVHGDLVAPRRPTATDPPPPPSFAATGEVAPGVHVVTLSGFRVMFVEFRDFVVAIEAPESHAGFETIPSGGSPSRITEAYLELIRETVPDKPVRYAVMSHHHSDHMGGLRVFAQASATLVVAEGHAAAARRMLSRPHTFAPDGWSGDPESAPRIETLSSRREITDGTRTLVILNTGSNPHTDENLFAWLPEEGIVFQGDLFYYVEGRPYPPTGRDTMNQFFAEHLRERGIEPRVVYGVHNRGAANGALLR